jgi:hypothetical protein
MGWIWFTVVQRHVKMCLNLTHGEILIFRLNTRVFATGQSSAEFDKFWVDYW